MGDDLETRLKSHARAFEGLMSLIPAEKYYGKDASITSTQWQKTKKQTREERQAAKRAKLDPTSHKSAQDVMDENARKRKRELEGEDAGEVSSDFDMEVEKEKPLEGLKASSSKAKKQKTKGSDVQANAEELPEAENDEDQQSIRAKARSEKRKQKLEKKKDKRTQKQQKQETKKATQEEFSKGLRSPEEADDDDEAEQENEMQYQDEDIAPLDVSGLVDEGQSTAMSSAAHSNVSSASLASPESSSSSVVPPSNDEITEKKESKQFKYDPSKHDAFRARLTAKLEAMREARKADGPDGRPAKNRAELIEARRKKAGERKAARKANRQVAKEDEERLKAEEQLARIRGGSGSPSLFPVRSSPDHERNLAFGRVAWKDGQQLESTLSGFLESGKKKGRSDAKTALEAAKKKQARISGYDEAKRKDIEEKDLWLNAKKRAQGEKVLDDLTLLKKTVKRQEKTKSKSKEQWTDRITNVQKGKEMKQKKREGNLKKRREEKGSKKGKKVKKPVKKVKKRPGFEGTFKAR
ncbi:surfeit locus protein 6-domain-containing protein [Massariosphaeria phaeospora]|uniref:Surfeit locus protein 6-domain-containing protein n=1 Tax=Massariosphaeria phaeospora TaxID=100035 RepID=A0A7C8MKY7_9PLEO|nr:surfeit locus protein 6-domain-containing protein [Massariosphaeria phaeospora]